MSTKEQAHILSVEFPSYGLYTDVKLSQENIKHDSVHVYDILVNNLKIKESQIIVIGRSMGSGPATYLASVRNPLALVLLTPYLSIRDAAVGFVGKVGSLVKDIFKNKEAIK